MLYGAGSCPDVGMGSGEDAELLFSYLSRFGLTTRLMTMASASSRIEPFGLTVLQFARLSYAFLGGKQRLKVIIGLDAGSDETVTAAVLYNNARKRLKLAATLLKRWAESMLIRQLMLRSKVNIC